MSKERTGKYFHLKIKIFYNEINDYLKNLPEMWMEPFEDLKVFNWIDQTRSDLLDWINNEKSLVFLRERVNKINDEKLLLG